MKKVFFSFLWIFVCLFNKVQGQYASTNMPVSASSGPTLSNLTLSSGTLSPSFSSATTTYTSSVSNDVTSVKETPTVTDATSTVKVNGVTVVSGSQSGSIPLALGNNTITTVVTAQDGVTTRTYTVTVMRSPASISYDNDGFYCQTGVGLVMLDGPAGGTYSASSPGLNINAATGTLYPGSSQPGNYTVTYSSTFNGSAYSTSTPVTVYANPKISFNQPAAVCSSPSQQTLSIPYTATAGTPNHYDLSADPSAPMPSFAAVSQAILNGNSIPLVIPANTPGGTYRFFLYLTNPNDCISTRYGVTVKIRSSSYNTITYASSPLCQTSVGLVSYGGSIAAVGCSLLQQD